MKNNERYLIAADIDGTFGNHTPTDFFGVNEKNIEVFEKLNEMGHITALATGRQKYFAFPIMQKLNYNPYLVHSNGSSIWTPENSLLKEQYIYVNPTFVSEIMEIPELNEKIMTYMFYNETEILTDRIENIYNKNLEKVTKANYKTYNYEKDGVPQGIYSASFMIKPDESLLPLITKLKKEYKDSLEIFLWTHIAHQDSWELEFVSKSAGKYNTLLSLATFYGIRKENIICFGDSINDIEMIDKFHTGVAMKNAIPKVKEVADYITEVDNKEGGVGYFLENFFKLNK